MLYVLKDIGITPSPTIFYFFYHLLFSGVSKPSSLYNFSLDVPLIAPVIACAELYWIDSSFWLNEASYMFDHIWCPQSRSGLTKDLQIANRGDVGKLWCSWKPSLVSKNNPKSCIVGSLFSYQKSVEGELTVGIL